MQIHNIEKTKKEKKRRIGRGGKRGTYSGRGQKGQKSRAGRKMEPIIRGLIKKYHKLRGYNFNVQRVKIRIINLDILENNFNPEDEISPKSLMEKGLTRRIKGKIPKIKILGKGELTKPFSIKRCLVSDSAKEKIEKAGGKIIKELK
jgi:large subunit ribosomal protein L15